MMMSLQEFPPFIGDKIRPINEEQTKRFVRITLEVLEEQLVAQHHRDEVHDPIPVGISMPIILLHKQGHEVHILFFKKMGNPLNLLNSFHNEYPLN